MHRTTHLASRDTTVVDAIPTTNLARTRVDVATTLARWRMLEVLDQVLCAHPGRRRHVHSTATRLSKGRRNAAALAAATAEGAEAQFWSWLERTAQPLVMQAGITDARWNVRVPGAPQLGFADTFSAAHRLVVEWKGLAFHRRPNQLQRDCDKLNAAMAAGLRLLTFTWTDVVRRPTYVTDTLGLLADAA